MKVFSLVFDYSLDTMINSGRLWAKEGYRGKDFIFKYSAASIATILHHNPSMRYDILTDDPGSLLREISAYDVPTTNLNVVDESELILKWKSHRFCFWPLIQVFDKHLEHGDCAMKLDNDLTCLKPIDDLITHKGAIVWKYERVCARGREYWGESLAARGAFGTDQFNIYNTGTWGLSKEYHGLAREIPSLVEKMISVDISSVSSFPEDMKAKANIWSCSDQTSNAYFIHKHNIPVVESHPWFEHHCYSHDAKKNVIERAAYLLKK